MSFPGLLCNSIKNHYLDMGCDFNIDKNLLLSYLKNV